MYRADISGEWDLICFKMLDPFLVQPGPLRAHQPFALNNRDTTTRDHPDSLGSLNEKMKW